MASRSCGPEGASTGTRLSRTRPRSCSRMVRCFCITAETTASIPISQASAIARSEHFSPSHGEAHTTASATLRSRPAGRIQSCSRTPTALASTCSSRTSSPGWWASTRSRSTGRSGGPSRTQPTTCSRAGTVEQAPGWSAASGPRSCSTSTGTRSTCSMPCRAPAAVERGAVLARAPGPWQHRSASGSRRLPAPRRGTRRSRRPEVGTLFELFQVFFDRHLPGNCT
mmetsp:Transcript_105474/g.286341  ORF Transcript_105474/g.286341 Transcript_105474/m.286341 type:complete len:226 (+) Transcript_105474:717-1394(+)